MKWISAIALCFILLLATNFKLYQIKTQSMEEVIRPGDIVLTIKSSSWSNFKKTNITAFQQGRYQATFIKRIVASEGDTLKIHRNEIKIKDTKIPHDSIFEMMVEESDNPDSLGLFSSKKYQKYLVRNLSKKDQLIALSGSENRLVIPEGYFFMVGDNYYESMDSRFWGFISKENIKGKVIWIF